MAEKVLEGADVGAGLEQVSGKRTAKSVGRDALCEGGLPCGIADLAGHGVVVKVATGDSAGARMRAGATNGQIFLRATEGQTICLDQEKDRSGDIHVPGLE